MLSRICQLIRRGYDLEFNTSIVDTRGLRAYPKSRTRSERLAYAKARASVARSKRSVE